MALKLRKHSDITRTYFRLKERRWSVHHINTGRISVRRSWDHQRFWSRARILGSQEIWSRESGRIWLPSHQPKPKPGDLWGFLGRMTGRESPEMELRCRRELIVGKCWPLLSDLLLELHFRVYRRLYSVSPAQLQSFQSSGRFLAEF